MRQADPPLRRRWAMLGAACAGAALAAVWVAPGATVTVRATLTVFLLATLAWVATPLDDTLIALSAALAAIAVGGTQTSRQFDALGSSTVWLLLASFVLAAGCTHSGIATRVTVGLARRSVTVAGMFRWLSLALALSSFVVPATTGRAALALPVFLAVAQSWSSASLTRALALLFPTVILLSASASLLGASAHLVVVDIVASMVGTEIGYARWFVLGVPFALVSCALSTEVILRMFLTQDERSQAVDTSALEALGPQRPMSSAEWRVGAVVAATAAGWATGSWHGIDASVIALIGAVAMTLPRIGAVELGDALREVPLNLVLFLAATLALGEAILSSGAAVWLSDGAFRSVLSELPAVASLGLIATIAATSHLVIGSRSARASVLTPAVVLFGDATGLNPAALAFLAAVGSGYCLTLVVSAKPVALFASAHPHAYRPADLARLSAVLLPVHVVLLVIFALLIWPMLGLALH